MKYEELFESEECPECGIKVPKRQIKNIGVCERCSMEGRTVKARKKTTDFKYSILDIYGKTVPDNTQQIKSETGDRIII